MQWFSNPKIIALYLSMLGSSSLLASDQKLQWKCTMLAEYQCANGQSSEARKTSLATSKSKALTLAEEYLRKTACKGIKTELMYFRILETDCALTN